MPPPHVYNNKSFRLASSCALYIIRLILTRALRSTVVGVLLSLFPSATRRSGGSTLEEKLAGFFPRERKFFSQTLNPKRKRKYRKNSTVISKHTHRNALIKRFSYNTCAKRNTRISRSKRTEEYFLSLFFFGVLLILDTNFASLARAFSALFGIERIYGPCPHSTLLQK